MVNLKICVLHSPKQYVVKCPPQGLMSISAYLKSKKIEISILDANIHYINPEEIKRESFEDFKERKRNIKEFVASKQEFPENELTDFFSKNKFDIVISDCHYTGTINYSLKTFQLIKKILPESIIIVGGLHSTMFHDELLKTELIDIIIRGEGEEVIYEIIQKLDKNEGLKEIEGISYLSKDREIINNPGHAFIKDLNNLAPVFTVYDDFEIELYRDYIKAKLGPFWYDQDPAGVIILSRGCIGRCTFCNARMIDKGRYRSFSVENTLFQLESIYEKYKPKNFKIYDAMFGANKRQFRSIVDFFKKVQIPWGFETRVDIFKSEDIELLKGSSCKYILFGLESVDLDTLKFNNKISMKKDESYYEQAAKIFRQVMDEDIICAISLLFGLPNEKEDIFEKTIKYFTDNKLVTKKLELFPYVPIMYPGTLLWDLTPSEKRCYDWEKYFITTENVIDENKIIYNNPTISNEKLHYFVDNCAKILFENSDLTNRDFFQRDLDTIISEGYDAIESPLDEEWFRLSIKHAVDKWCNDV